MTSDDFTTRALAEGRIDEAIRHLRDATPSDAEPRLLAQILTQRGRFNEALTVVRHDIETRSSAESISASDLRERGNAAWRADQLGDALTDLQEALRRTTDPTLSQPIQADLAVLEDQVESLRLIARRMQRVDGGVVAVGAGLIAALLLAAGWFRRRGRSA